MKTLKRYASMNKCNQTGKMKPVTSAYLLNATREN